MAKFKYAIPAAKYKPDAIRATDGTLIPTLKKIRPARRLTKLGQTNRRIISVRVENGVEYSYHATKGWRTRSVQS